jgi:hypothetical protein
MKFNALNQTLGFPIIVPPSPKIISPLLTIFRAPHTGTFNQFTQFFFRAGHAPLPVPQITPELE